jgi:hypothetical protein
MLVMPLLMAGTIGWLCGDSCSVSYCKEDCDPCLQHCLCSNVCNHTHATFQATHALTEFNLTEHASGEKLMQRTFNELMGLSVERAGGPPWPPDDDVVRFARGVLAVNPSHLTRRDGSLDFVLDSVLRYETAIVVQLHQVAQPGHDNLVSFLFDPRGNLIEIDQSLAL